MEKRQIGRIIARVAATYGDPVLFERRAKEAAGVIPPEDLWELSEFYHKPPHKPEKAKGDFEGLGEWMEVCQETVFAILYHIGGRALPVVRRAAFGDYDWTQPKAMRVLTRFVNDGVRAEEIVNEFLFELPYMDDPRSREYAEHFLAQMNHDSPELREAVGRAVEEAKERDAVAALRLLESLAEVSPDAARAEEEFLRAVMRGEGVRDRHPLLDGALISLDEEGNEREVIWPYGPPPPDLHRIRAALLLFRLFPEDAEAVREIERFAREHPEAEVRRVLLQYL